jgi:hypothetical protein
MFYDLFECTDNIANIQRYCLPGTQWITSGPVHIIVRVYLFTFRECVLGVLKKNQSS